MLFCKEELILLLIHPINLVVTYPLNENKPQLLATFKNSDWEVTKQLLVKKTCNGIFKE